MNHYSISYTLKKGEESYTFTSEKDACKFLGVKSCSVASSYYRKCKCKGYEVIRGEITSHNESSKRLYSIWISMRRRCNDKKHMHYKNYGGKGIKVCDEWCDYESFRDWALEHGYNDNLTLDRKDNNGNYEPNNCRWATYIQQGANKRTNHYVVVNGERMIAKECERRYSIPKSTILYRANHGKDILTGKKIDKE